MNFGVCVLRASQIISQHPFNGKLYLSTKCSLYIAVPHVYGYLIKRCVTCLHRSPNIYIYIYVYLLTVFSVQAPTTASDQRAPSLYNTHTHTRLIQLSSADEDDRHNDDDQDYVRKECALGFTLELLPMQDYPMQSQTHTHNAYAPNDGAPLAQKQTRRRHESRCLECPECSMQTPDCALPPIYPICIQCRNLSAVFIYAFSNALLNGLNANTDV